MADAATKSHYEPDHDAGITEIQARLERLEAQLGTQNQTAQRSVSLLVFSGELDKLLAAFNIATAAAACSMKVSMFFTFWGTAALKQRTLTHGKNLVERMFAYLLPGGLQRRALSRCDFAGVGRVMLTGEMRRKNVSDLPLLIEQCGASGVEIYVCQMSMNLMGIRAEELIDYPHMHYCGAAKFLQLANSADTNLMV